MKILVCGSRHFNNYDMLREELDKHEITEIIEGGAVGADRMAATYARAKSIKFTEFPANWEKYGKAAGPIRNLQMLKEGVPDLVVAFMGPNSRGTAHMVTIAQKQGVETIIVDLACRVVPTTDKLTSEA